MLLKVHLISSKRTCKQRYLFIAIGLLTSFKLVSTLTSCPCATQIDDILKQLGKGEVSLHVYENASRVYIRYKENDQWHMRDLAEYLPINFHSEGTLGVPGLKANAVSAVCPLESISIDKIFFFKFINHFDPILQKVVAKPSTGEKDIKSILLNFKRKEHYWRRGRKNWSKNNKTQKNIFCFAIYRCLPLSSA